MSKVAISRNNLSLEAPKMKPIEPFIEDMPGSVEVWNDDIETEKAIYGGGVPFISAFSGSVVLVAPFLLGGEPSNFLTAAIVTACSALGLSQVNKRTQIHKLKNIYEEAFGVQPTPQMIRRIAYLQNSIRFSDFFMDSSEKRYLSRSHAGVDTDFMVEGGKIATGLMIGSDQITVMWRKLDNLSLWDQAANDVVDAYMLITKEPEAKPNRKVEVNPGKVELNPGKDSIFSKIFPSRQR